MVLGTIANPYTLSDALKLVSYGDTLWLRAGTYTGNFTLRNGGASKTLTLRAYPNELVVLDGNFSITGDSIRLQDLVVTDSFFTDRSSNAGGHVAIDANGANLEIVNCIIKNGIQGLQSSAAKVNLLVYGCLFSLNGWEAQLGHGLYPQNNAAYKTLEHCIICDNFGYGAHCWGSSGQSNYWKILENISFRNGYLRPSPNNVSLPNYQIGGQSPNQGHIIRGNISYAGEMRVGDGGGGNDVTNTEISDNVLVYSVPLRLADFPLIGNTIFDNRFYGNVEWGANGWTNEDWADNSYNAAGSMPDEYFIFPNRYDSNRANLAIFNLQAQADIVQIDVSAIFNNGDVIAARNVQNYFYDVQNLVVINGMIVVNMQIENRSTEAASGDYVPASTFPDFGAFVLERQP